MNSQEVQINSKEVLDLLEWTGAIMIDGHGTLETLWGFLGQLFLSPLKS